MKEKKASWVSKRMVVWFGVLTIGVLITGCKGVKVAPDKISLITAPEQIEIAGRKYLQETAVWRDFMPMTPPEGSSLMVVVKIIVADSLEFPAHLNADRLWVINDKKDVWETEFTGENRGAEPNKLEKSASNGPKWGPGIEVDVVTRIVNVKTGKSFLLRASRQKITRTD